MPKWDRFFCGQNYCNAKEYIDLFITLLTLAGIVTCSIAINQYNTNNQDVNLLLAVLACTIIVLVFKGLMTLGTIHTNRSNMQYSSWKEYIPAFLLFGLNIAAVIVTSTNSPNASNHTSSASIFGFVIVIFDLVFYIFNLLGIGKYASGAYSNNKDILLLDEEY